MRVTIYVKDQCPLCDEAKDHLKELAREYPHHLVEVDIENEPSLVRRYGEVVPVIQVGPYTLRAPFDRTQLQVTLAAAKQGLDDEERDEPVKGANGLAVTLNRGVRSLGVHWLAVFNLLVLMYVGLPFAAPTLMKAGYERPARWIYTAYSPLCHQLAFRSWFLFGDQIAYPRQLAGTEFVSYGAATGMDESDLFEARAFLGNDRIGYKVALCERDVAIYGGILLAGLAFALVRDRLKPLPITLWVLFGVIPIALDGGSQLVAGLPIPGLSWVPARESTPFLRSLTGALFGVMNVWLAYPYVEETMAETRAIVAGKLEASRRRELDSRAPESGGGN